MVIKDLLKERKMTIAELSKKISRSQTAIHLNFKKNNYKYSLLVEIAKALDVSLSYIVIETEKTKSYKTEDENSEILNDVKVEYGRLTGAGKVLFNENIELKKRIEEKDLVIKMFKDKYEGS